jgi:propanol-preferring alcohol dehydrogenase
MKAMLLKAPRSIEAQPLAMAEVDKPTPGPKEILIKINACGICHTDLHIVEGELPSKKLPVIPGHQVVGIVEAAGKKVTRFRAGDRVGVAWLNSTCGKCEFCLKGKENLCEKARFTGYDVDGGYADYTVVSEDFAYPVPKVFSDIEAAPLLCAGVIGYRALRLSEIVKGGRLGLFGLGEWSYLVIKFDM